LKRCIIVRNSDLSRDIRVPKLFSTLNEIVEIKFIGWKRCGNRKNLGDSENEKHFSHSYLQFSIPYGMLSIPFLPIWWLYISLKLVFEKYEVVHVINFDSLIPVLIIAKIKNKKVIYEILDTFEDGGNLPIIIRNFIILVDKFFMRFVDYVVLVDDEQVIEFNGIPAEYQVVYDSPIDQFEKFEKKFNIDDKLIIFYAGALYSNRNLNINYIYSAIKNIDNGKLIIAGYGDLVNQIKEWEVECPEKVNYLGQIKFSDVIKHTYNADVIVVLRDPLPLINKFICGSTIFNAMMCGTPIIARNFTSTGTKVIKSECGIVINLNENELLEALLFIKNNKSKSYQMGINGRSDFEKNYCWNCMKCRLLQIYDLIIRD